MWRCRKPTARKRSGCAANAGRSGRSREALSKPYATVRRFLAALGLNGLPPPPMQAPPPIVRYERERPGEMLHLDTKKLRRIVRPSHRVTGNRRDSVDGAGWEVLHLAIDDHSRLAYTEVLVDERRDTTTGFLARAIDWFSAHGVTIERIMTDNGSACRSRSSPTPCASAASPIGSPDPIPREPTARPSASSRPRCASGPTLTPTATQPNERANSPAGSTSTITTVDIPPSTSSLPSAASRGIICRTSTQRIRAYLTVPIKQKAANP